MWLLLADKTYNKIHVATWRQELASDFFLILFTLFFLVFESANYIRPKNWHRDLWELDPENPDNNGLQNEDLVR
jgi:hypothetical protein